MYSAEWPSWLRYLVIFAAALAALASIWGQVRDSRLLRAVARELLLRDGQDGKTLEAAVKAPHEAGEDTVKATAQKAADDSKAALEVVNELKVQLNRYILHEARKDLGSSKLAKEADEFLQKVDEERRQKEGANGET